MRIRQLVLGLGMSALLLGCNEEKTQFTLADIPGASTGDSILFYSGQIRAFNYWEDANDDEHLASEESREEYLKGFRDGIQSMKENASYNDGFLAGVEVARNMSRYSRRNNIAMNPDIICKSLEAGLLADTVIDIDNIRERYYDIVNNVEERHIRKEVDEACKVLARKAPSLGMGRISNDMYARTVTPGMGNNFRQADRVKVLYEVATLQGDHVIISLPEKLMVGDKFQRPIINRALANMKPGETKEFAVAAISVFGSKCDQMDLHPSDILIMRLTVNLNDESYPTDAVR